MITQIFRAYNKADKKIYPIHKLGVHGTLISHQLLDIYSDKAEDGIAPLKTVIDPIVEIMQGIKINEIEVFCGDIIKVYEFTFNSSGKLPDIFEVKFKEGCFELIKDNIDLMGLRLNYVKSFEIIGNKYKQG